uniref:Uncharacterized protein n=1 Tax=Balaenoptera musculus TaxID=9771 RepID=A0A8C0D7G9_BALMU
VFPSPHRHQLVLSILLVAPPPSSCFQSSVVFVYRRFESNLFGSSRLWHNHNRNYSAISGPKAETLWRLGVWGWSGTGSAWASRLALLRVFRKPGSGGDSWSLNTLVTVSGCPLADLPVALVMRSNGKSSIGIILNMKENC